MRHQLLRLIGAALIAPAVTVLAAWAMQRYTLANPDLVAGGFVTWRTAPTADELAAAARLVAGLDVLIQAALALGILPLALFAGQGAVAAVASRRQPWLATAFPPLIRLTVWTMSATTAGHVALVLATVWFAERIFLGGFHTLFFWPLALAGLWAAARLVRAGSATAQPAPLHVCAAIMDPQHQAHLIERVGMLALKLGARPPDQVIAGLEPCFYVTSCDIRLAESGRILKGETLHVSLPYMSLLSIEEFDAVLGHELGHFRGGDTAYSMRFIPIYVRLFSTLDALIDRGGRVPLAAIPSILVLDFLLSLFQSAHLKLERERELNADAASVEAAGKAAAATALLKVSLHAHAVEACVSEALDGELAAEAIFEQTARLAAHQLERDTWRTDLVQALALATPHPTDSHPPDSVRLHAMGVSPHEMTREMLTPPSVGGASHLILGAESVCAAQVEWLRKDFEASAVTAISPMLAAISEGAGDPAGGFARG